MLDPKRVIKIITVHKYIVWGIVINILHGFFTVQIWKDFSLGWWNVLASAWFQASAILKIWHCGSHFALVYVIVHEKPRMDFRESWHNCPWQYFRSFDRGIVIMSVFLAPDRVVLPAFIAEQVTLEVVDMFLGAGPWPVISQTRVWKWRNLSVRFWRQCFINPWLQTALFLIIAIATTSAAVIWQFAGKGGFCRFHFGWSFRFLDYIPPQLTKYGVYNADKYFSRNK